jgi:hypothetical protein
MKESVLKRVRMAALAGMVLLSAFAAADVLLRDESRTVMTFYTVSDGRNLVEERTVKNAGARSLDTEVKRYVEEVLLGPMSHGAAGFFPVGTVQACIVDGETAFIGLSAQAALAGVTGPEGGYTVDSMRAVDTLREDIGRNFRQLKNIEIFIDGREAAP